MSRPQYWLVVPAAGTGQRMQAPCPKQYLRLNNRFVVDVTLSRLLDSGHFAGCMVALDGHDQWWQHTDSAADSRVEVCGGGSQRHESVLAALVALAPRPAPGDWVLVHDVARPCLVRNDLDRLIDRLREHPVGGLLAAPVTDTIKQADSASNVAATVDRSTLWRALTPQMFRYQPLREALEEAVGAGVSVTDEAAAMERMGQNPCLVEGRADNIKITRPEDLALARFILDQQGQVTVGAKRENDC